MAVIFNVEYTILLIDIFVILLSLAGVFKGIFWLVGLILGWGILVTNISLISSNNLLLMITVMTLLINGVCIILSPKKRSLTG